MASSAVNELKSHVPGELIVPSDLGYDIARTVFHASIDRRPVLIAQCVDREDVIRAVNFVRQHNLLVSIHGTGHNVAGFAVCDESLVIDLSRMKGITVDAPARRFRADGGCTWGAASDAL